MNLQEITLISFGQFDEKFLRMLADAVAFHSRLPVSVAGSHVDISDYYDPVRRQYNGNSLISTIDRLYGYEGGKVIGLFSVDLFIPILTFIFGQAFLNGRTAIASAFRLSNERYGLKPDEDLMLGRLAKEVVHELGHTLGLIHCHEPGCVMRSSTYVEEIDQKGAEFCFRCTELIIRNRKT